MTVDQIDKSALDDVERQARLLAKENRLAEPAIIKVLWFPSAQEVRLVEFDETIPSSDDGKVHPYFFRPSPQDGLSSPSAIALIRPEEFRRLELPMAWGAWESAVEIEDRV